MGDPSRALEFFRQILPSRAEGAATHRHTPVGVERHIILNQMAACQTRLGRHKEAVKVYKEVRATECF